VGEDRIRSGTRSPAGGGRRELCAALEAIQGGGGARFLLLRETSLGDAAIDEGDIDLLCARDAVSALISKLDVLGSELGLGLLVERSAPRKTRVSLFSADLRHSLHLDLWTDLWQLADGTRSLRWRDLSGLSIASKGGFRRLPERLELAVYLEHLRVKRKNLASPGVRARLEHYVGACATDPDVSEALRSVAADPPAELPPRLHAWSRTVLDGALGPQHRWLALFRRAQDPARRAWMRRVRPPPGARAVALIGADGIGKSTLGKVLAGDREGREHVLGKSFYRRGLLFRGLYRLNRRLGAPFSQESIDEALPALAYTVAALRLRRRLSDPATRGLLIDRFLPDFLYLGRKGDRARFSRWAWISRVLYVSLPVVHLTADHAVLAGRKLEISPAGLRRYDRDMTRFYTSLPFVRYLRLQNAGSVDQASRVLCGRLAQLLREDPV
jgi:hypothetical protein